MTTTRVALDLAAREALGRRVETLFRGSGALREGHFALKSGRHGDRYLEKFQVLQFPTVVSELCASIAAPFRGDGGRSSIDVVAGPTTGGVILAFEVARQLGGRSGRAIRGIFAEPSPGTAGGRELRRGFAVRSSERVVLVDDILTTGASLHETVTAVRSAGGEPRAAVVIADRSTEPLDLGFPLTSLGRIEIESWAADSCPLCREGRPLTKPGTSVRVSPPSRL